MQFRVFAFEAIKIPRLVFPLYPLSMMRTRGRKIGQHVLWGFRKGTMQWPHFSRIRMQPVCTWLSKYIDNVCWRTIKRLVWFRNNHQTQIWVLSVITPSHGTWKTWLCCKLFSCQKNSLTRLFPSKSFVSLYKLKATRN